MRNFRPPSTSTPQGLTLLFAATFRRTRHCLLALALPSALPRAQPLDSPHPPDLNAVAHQILALANADRARHHLPPLAWNPALAHAAEVHAGRMAQEPTIEHQYPAEPDLLHRAAGAGAHLSVISENLLRGSRAVLEQPAAPTLIEQTWMASPVHRANLLDPRLNAAGISLVHLGNSTAVVEDLARTSPASLDTAGLEATERAVVEILLAHGIAVALPTIATRAACRTPAAPGVVTPVLTIAWDGPNPTSLPAALLSQLPRHSHAEVGACPGIATAHGFTTTRVTVLLP